MSFQEIKNRGVVAVIRDAKVDTIVPIAKALQQGGVTALEITMETPKALSIIEILADQMDDDVLVGAGTVLDPETARAAIMSGAKFVFSPTVNIETIKMTKRYGVISVPGAFTPTEVLTAYEHGADLIKVFPANTGGPGHLKAIRGPLPHIPLMPTGGIDLNNVGSFIKAGAIAVGVGSTLVDCKKPFNDKYLQDLIATAKAFVSEVEKARSKS
ncbi:bifunctional 4-hydroxy-2-oxoglutarate aldolase/2-dehydro-3-deoxy-phosphogluconate aldolase [Bacillus sp. T3]|uniref:bifunctional 4-hydroxy-2-oxoglutarate aldolase/2-dehydro-3-deoxy-phosphogluconate aldolase n=1 Tax=Bacillus sp. T3 TaxID=467262 RepID=UPI002981881F|nr:bifunctional 4-hydroxy-2-oxoglutarate aldolase/2-dehydro-3-deoxy-phosphogluconate aldolase [Bacillus sp. T3]